MKVFISSTQKDLDLAKDLARRLQQIGLQTFIAEKAINLEGNWVKQIERRLRAVDEVIVLLTDYAIASTEMMTELGAVYGLHKNVTPIMVGVNVNELPPLLKNLPYIKYAEVEDYLAKLKKRVDARAKVHA